MRKQRPLRLKQPDHLLPLCSPHLTLLSFSQVVLQAVLHSFCLPQLRLALSTQCRSQASGTVNISVQLRIHRLHIRQIAWLPHLAVMQWLTMSSLVLKTCGDKQALSLERIRGALLNNKTPTAFLMVRSPPKLEHANQARISQHPLVSLPHCHKSGHP